jgi:hypothetical protein
MGEGNAADFTPINLRIDRLVKLFVLNFLKNHAEDEHYEAGYGFNSKDSSPN